MATMIDPFVVGPLDKWKSDTQVEYVWLIVNLVMYIEKWESAFYFWWNPMIGSLQVLQNKLYCACMFTDAITTEEVRLLVVDTIHLNGKIMDRFVIISNMCLDVLIKCWFQHYILPVVCLCSNQQYVFAQTECLFPNNTANSCTAIREMFLQIKLIMEWKSDGDWEVIERWCLNSGPSMIPIHGMTIVHTTSSNNSLWASRTAIHIIAVL